MSEHLATDRSHAPFEEQFEDAGQQKDAATLGMWTFLATEVLFFGGLFASYTIYRHQWPHAFRRGSMDLKWYLGGLNTAVLLLSSFFMAMAVNASARGSNKGVIRYLILTILAAACFLYIKGTEYYVEYREHLVPGTNFYTVPPPESRVGALTRHFSEFDRWFDNKTGQPYEGSAQRPPNEQLFMLFYFIMTAIHATHMIIGICIMVVLLLMARRKAFSAKWHTPVEMFGLYWHFVDLVWVFLFPALYLLRQS